tara:strand:+ start:3474 stop:3839 length:366 start_codon:yes stop_codon:yes gene_type:complete
MSITNFEDHTNELNDRELEILPLVIHSFRKYEKDNPIKSEDIVKKMNIYLFERDFKIKMTGARLRKMVNYIRSNSLIPLIATSKGYFTSNNKKDIQDQIISLMERARSIVRCADGLNKFID